MPCERDSKPTSSEVGRMSGATVRGKANAGTGTYGPMPANAT